MELAGRQRHGEDGAVGRSGGRLSVGCSWKVVAVPACAMPDDSDSVTPRRVLQFDAPISTKGPMGRRSYAVAGRGGASCLDPDDAVLARVELGEPGEQVGAVGSVVAAAVVLQRAEQRVERGGAGAGRRNCPARWACRR